MPRRDRGLNDARLRALAQKGLTMDDRPHARIAADTWLCRRPSVRADTEDGERS